MHALSKRQNIDVLFKGGCFSNDIQLCTSVQHTPGSAHLVKYYWQLEAATGCECALWLAVANYESFACPIVTCFKAADMLGKQAGEGGKIHAYLQDMRANIASM